jgi:large repetitive protein
MNHAKKLIVLAAGAVGAIGLGTTGWTYWSTSGSGSAAATVGTWKTDTTTAAGSTQNPSVVGQQVTYTAAVTSDDSGTPTGNVAFFNGGTPIAGCGGAEGVALNGSTATCAQTYSSVGSHSITARYLGDADFNPSVESVAITQVVNPASTATSLTVTGSPATYGAEDGVVFTSTVTASFGTPTGTVAVRHGATILCSISLPATTCSPDPTALNASPTSYSITAVYSGTAAYAGSTSPTQALTVRKATPLITWPAPADITYGTQLGAAHLNASASTTGTFTYNPPAGTILPAGSTSLGVTFEPGDTTNYESATAGVSSIIVNKAPLTISASSASMTYGGPVPTITPTYSGFVNGEVSTVLTTQPTCATTATTTSAAGSSQTSSCSGASAANYAITYVPGNVTVNKADQIITFTSTAPAAAKFGGSYTISATASAGLPVSFSSATTTVCTVSGSNVSFVGVGQCTINANQAGGTNYNAAPQAQQTFTVYKADQTITFTSTPTGPSIDGPPYTVTASATSGLAVTFSSATPSVCTVSGSTTTFVASGTCTIDANQAGDTTWNAAPQTQQSFLVTGPLTITGSARNGGNVKHIFSGSGGTPGATVTVSVCAINNFPSCSVITTAIATVGADGTWTTGQSNNNIRGQSTYYARAVQATPAKTSVVFPFPL